MTQATADLKRRFGNLPEPVEAPVRGMSLEQQSEQIDLARTPSFALGALEVCPATREVVAGDGRETIEPRVMQVLVALARRRGEVVSRDDLITACWNGRVVGDDAINRCTGRIRRLAETYGGFSLETIARVGYRLEETAQGRPQSEGTAPPAAAALPVRRQWIAAGLAAVVLLAAAIGIAYWSPWLPAKELVVRAPVRQLIAVLPFTPLSGDSETKLFGDAIAAAVAEALSKIGQPVVPPAETLQFQGTEKARAARVLQAMYVIDGDVLREKGRVRVSVRLDDAIHGTTVFAHTFDEPAERASALPDRVAAYIAALSWGGDITRWDTRFAPTMLRAFEQQKRGDLFAAYQTIRALAAAEPDNADIQRVYAMSTVNLLYASAATRKMSLIAEAREAANRSLRLRPGWGEAYAALASTTPHYFWADREAYLKKAQATNPESIGVTEYMTWLLNDVGRFRDSEPTARSAFERFPYHPVSYQRQIERLLGAGDAAAALKIIPAARRLWPDDNQFVLLNFEATAFEGAPADAEILLRDQEALKQLPPGTAALWRGMVRALRDRRPADIAALSRACRTPTDNWWSCMTALTMLGRLDDAFRIAAGAYPDQRGPTPEAVMQKWLANAELPSTRYLFAPEMAPLRADRRFRDIVERVGLLPYWRSVRHAPDFCAAEPVPLCRLLIAS